MNYEIIATLGPASSQPSLWADMLASGVTAFRLNTSHLSLPLTWEWLEKLAGFFQSTGTHVPVVLDLQGSKWRLGDFPARSLTAGQSWELICSPTSNQPSTLPVPHPDFFTAAASSSGEVILNDAKVRLQIEHMHGETLTARVTQGGPLSSHKGITLAASTYRQEALPEKDQAILAHTQSIPFIRYAISYIKDAVELAAYRGQMGSGRYLIAKLERPQAVAEAHQMTRTANELWLCRGDLGAELGLKALAGSVQHFSSQVTRLGVPVMMAGQVLEHMTRQPVPTRSEVCYLYDTLSAGYQGVILSDETAIGDHPLESCKIAALFK